MALRRACASLLVSALFGGASATGHPVEKVITLLQGLSEKAKEEGKSEEVLYTKFEYWCATSIKSLSSAIEKEKATIEQLEEEIDSHSKSIEVLSSEIKALEGEIQDLDAKGDEAQTARNSAASLYAEQSGAHTSTIEAIVSAIEALETSKTETATLLVSQQRVARVVALLGLQATAQQREELEAFTRHAYEPKERPDLKAEGDNGGHVKRYSFKSQSVIELLKELKLKFEDELTQMNTEETNSINGHELASTARAQLRGAKVDAKDEKNSILGEASVALIQAKSDLQSTQDDLAADSDTLANTNKACDVKKSEWNERSEIRANEIKAIETAVEILAKVTDVRTEAPGNPVPPPSPVDAPAPVFLQLGNPKLQRALELLRKEARLSHSSAIDQLAQELVAKKEGPFDQVINAIEKMIFHLQHEQKEEDDHKNWCDLELSKTQASISDKQDKMDELSLKISSHAATATSLANDMQEADKMVADITAHAKESTEIRKIGSKENDLAVKDAEDAQTALSNAISVLKEFYKGSGAIEKESWEFVQRSKAPVDLPDTPSTWSAGYTSVADPSAQPDGIVSVLEKVSADFAQMESDTKAQEETDQQAYDEDMKSCAVEKARRTKESEMKSQERKRVLDKQKTMEAEHKAVAGEHEATNQYLKDLQPACVEGSSSYDDRKAARAQEITALKEAQDLLHNAFEQSTPSPSFLQQRRLRGA